jgi:hypothetical protein
VWASNLIASEEPVTLDTEHLHEKRVPFLGGHQERHCMNSFISVGSEELQTLVTLDTYKYAVVASCTRARMQQK